MSYPYTDPNGVEYTTPDRKPPANDGVRVNTPNGTGVIRSGNVSLDT